MGTSLKIISAVAFAIGMQFSSSGIASAAPVEASVTWSNTAPSAGRIEFKSTKEYEPDIEPGVPEGSEGSGTR